MTAFIVWDNETMSQFTGYVLISILYYCLSVAQDEGQATLSLHAPLVLWGSNPLTPGLEGYPGEIGCPTLVIEDVLALSV